VEDKDSEIGFIQALLKKLKEKQAWFIRTKNQALEKAEKLLESVEVELKADEVGSISLKWNQSKAVSNLRQSIVDLLKELGTGLIIIDELPVMLNRLMNADNGPQRVTDFLHWLRSIRQTPGNEVRWVFCGSIGLDSFAERLKLTKTINDLYSFPIGAFNEETATRFLIRIGHDNEFNLPIPIRTELLNQIGWPLPYYLQLVFRKLHAVCALQRKLAPDSNDLNSAFEQSAVHSNLGTWMERLDEQLDANDAYLTKSLLDTLSKKSDGFKRSNLEQHLLKLNVTPDSVKDKASEILKMLERDGYLLSQNGKYAFRSPLLRMFWNNSRNL
jgi:hypothetical protein